DKTFFFSLLEANRRREAPNADNASTINIPTPAGYASLSQIPLDTNQTTQSRQAVLNALSFLPRIHQQITSYSNIRNQIINGVPVETGSARIPLAAGNNYWYIANRLDHLLTTKDTLSYRNHFDKRSDFNATSNLGFGTRWDADQNILAQSHALSEIH